MRIVKVSAVPIELFKVMKFGNMADSGGEAKSVISDGLVMVNGEVETRKRKKIHSGDIIAYEGDSVRVEIVAE